MPDSIKVDLRSNISSVIAKFEMLPDAIRNKAAVNALNRALDQSATEASRQIRARYNLKASAVSAAMKKKRASLRGNQLYAVLSINGARIPLVEFEARWARNQPGATVQVLKGGARKTVLHAFIATMKSGHQGVFTRQTKAGTWSKRLPIRELYSISIPQAFLNKTVQDAVKKMANDSFVKNFQQQLKYLGAA